MSSATSDTDDENIVKTVTYLEEEGVEGIGDHIPPPKATSSAKTQVNTKSKDKSQKYRTRGHERGVRKSSNS